MKQSYQNSWFIFRSCLLFTTALLFCVLLYPTTAQAETHAIYKVVSGDNLTFISARFGITLKALKKSNNLQSDQLAIGQELRIDNPFHKSSSKKTKWIPPCRDTGKVLRPFGKYKEKDILMARTGVDLACPADSKIFAPATAIVRYIGPLDGFGTVMILEHANGYSTVYAPVDEKTVKVREGSAVNQRHFLARTGQPVLENSPAYLHIELRKNKIAIKPNPLHH